jgi:hypothetical protein
MQVFAAHNAHATTINADVRLAVEIGKGLSVFAIQFPIWFKFVSQVENLATMPPASRTAG